MISKVGGLIHIEGFELSPRNEAVLTTKGRLRRCFPGCSFAMDMRTFEQSDFQATMAYTLAKMSHQPAVETKLKVKKAGQMHDEIRDTTHPKVVTELFMGGFLRSVSTPVDVSHLSKNTREEVMCLDSLLPWRRSPLWLLVRVALQLAFTRSSPLSKLPEDPYKTFMVLLMSHVLKFSHQASISTEFLYAMNCKLARRVLKLGSSTDGPGLLFVQNVMQNTQKIIDTRWTIIAEQDQFRYDPSCLERLNFREDTFITLPTLDAYIKSVVTVGNSGTHFTFQPAPALVQYHAGELPDCLFASSAEYVAYNLRAFETWVALHLDQWLKLNKPGASTCSKLGQLIKNYHSVAFPSYSDNPEATSVMVLTILEVWIACDVSAIFIHASLGDYDPGIPQDLLQCLSLPFKSQMERLLRAEDYLIRRRARARFSAPSIFRDFGLPTSFSVRYFHKSVKHQQLLKNIENQASRLREEKRKELRETKEKHKSLMRDHDHSECEYHEIVVDRYNNLREQRHSTSCRKCRYLKEAASLSIQVYEWPLPAVTSEACSAVFELKVPLPFGAWRDTTVFFLLDILKSEHGSIDFPSDCHTLQTYRGLQSYFVPYSSMQRIALLSQVKPHGVTHRLTKSIPDTTEEDVCLNNGLRYRYHDWTTGSFVKEFCDTDQIPKLCTYKLPTRSSSLQQFLFRPAAMPNGRSPNTVIASQSACPEHMSLDEYKAFSTIPLGFRIQWQNILLQLFAPSVDFKKVETELLILQTINQAGPPSNNKVLRAGHESVDKENLASSLLAGLLECLPRFKTNWESSQALSTFITLARRLLSLTSAHQIRGRCLSYLADVRMVAFSWINLLRDKAHKATNDCRREDFISKAVESALICVDSFSVDDRVLADELALTENASMFIQCAIIIQEGSHVVTKTSNPMIPILLLRWKWLAYHSYPILSKGILEMKSRSLDDAVKKSWSAYRAGGGWSKVSKRVDYWLVSQTAAQVTTESLCVHYNLLTGELLVNGVPLARLPSEYEFHPTYRALFGHSSVEVMPSALPGMRFSGKKNYAGYTIHFGMKPVPGADPSTGSDLLVLAVKGDRTWHLVPSRILQGDFPTAFVNDFVHWYDITNGCLTFLPMEDPWSFSMENWSLTRVRAGTRSGWHLMRNGMSLISIRSRSVGVLSSILTAIVDPPRVHIVFHHSSSSLEINLPQLQLGFHLKLGASSVQSRQFRGMSIDPNQSLGTLVGLHNKIILKDEKSSARLVIIPDGSVSCTRNGNHLHVTIKKESATRAHAYRINDQLGKLVDNGSLRSMLFLAYLHGITSFCLPDPLTQRTGTEQALLILNSAAVRSCGELRQEDMDLLGQIAHLTPERSYYPRYERVMQTVKWSSDLDFLAQHAAFYKSVKYLFAQMEKAQFFYPDSRPSLPDIDHIDSDLLARDCIRSCTFRVSGFGAEDHIIEHDVTYSARDRDQNSDEGCKSFIMSDLVYQGPASVHSKMPSNLSTGLRNLLAKQSGIWGPGHTLPCAELNYDAEFLLDWSQLLSTCWCTLHKTLSQAAPRFDKFRLMMWLSTLAFAKTSDMTILQTIASLFLIPEIARIVPPYVTTFRLPDGDRVDRSNLSQVIRSALRSFEYCPEAKLVIHEGESYDTFKNRRQRQFESSQSRVIDKFVSTLAAQWPCEAPLIPSNTDFPSYLNMEQATKAVKQKFKTWHDNYRFSKYLDQIGTSILRQRVDPVDTTWTPFTTPTWNNPRRRAFISIDDIFSGAAPCVPPSHTGNLCNLLSCSGGRAEIVPRLTGVIQRLEAEATSRYKRSYVASLRESLRHLQVWVKDDYELSEAADIKERLLDYLCRCKEEVQKVYGTISSTVTTATDQTGASSSTHRRSFSVAAAASVSPRLSPILFLQQLTRGRWKKLANDWRHFIVRYALALTELQRAERLYTLSDSRADMIKELENPGHTNLNPLDYPESLLLEVESGIMIREVQEQIAREMRNPSCANNAVMQLNMGEGKSSVIVPIVAASLADGACLVRVYVAKPQSKQMLQMLVSKMGGLLDRRVYHMPFSRALRLTKVEADAIGDMCKECMRNGGILLVQPEHILSFKLMGLECLISGNELIGHSLLRTQQFFDSSSRDIVDESDENFSVKFELIYTMGMQRPIEFSPERWICIQQVLDWVRSAAKDVRSTFPFSLEISDRRPGCFPRTRFLRSDAQEQILSIVAEQICETGLFGFPICRQPEHIRQAVLTYITKRNLTADDIARVEGPGGFWAETTRSTLLLLRGLIAGGVLAFAFSQKRWRVNNGLDATRRPRTKLAVPYRAKDNPTPRSEFSHPDVVIVLTSLSYYYGGLEDGDLFLAFSHLRGSDQADIEYQAWVRNATGLPSAFHQLNGLNLKDRSQCVEEVFPHLRFAKNVVDYFLTHLVFTKEMKEFPHKLSASGWDIGQIKAHPTTGFSGTNDSQKTLPLSVKHLDLPEQRHTNALVLEYLLQPENTVALMAPRKDESTTDAEVLLSIVTKMDPPTRVIIDVGAQILELSNLEVAKRWLELMLNRDRMQAVVFFDDSDELSVLDRKGRVEPLQTSAFVKQLDVCLVFLDEAHTRGTDLRLPHAYRAAVTLGPGVTKDRLVQGRTVKSTILIIC